MQKPKHNKRQHQMCRANMCPIFTLAAMPRFFAVRRVSSWKGIKISGHFLCRDSIFFCCALHGVREDDAQKKVREWFHVIHNARWKRDFSREIKWKQKNNSILPFQSASVSLGSHRPASSLCSCCASFWFSHRLHGTLESLISPNTPLTYRYVGCLHLREARKA